MAGLVHQGKMVFGLDIGTRSIVGTVGYKERDRFIVVAQKVKEHETRAMMDGQIHDIRKVSNTIAAVKEELEEEIGGTLKEVCIAAAGRVLRTVTTHVTYEFTNERVVLEEDVYALSAMGVEQAYEEFQKGNDTDIKFYCVGHSVIRYYLNNYPIGNPEEHKAASIGADMIVTFLPEDVVDGLYKAVEMAGLEVANLTLEPIAAIQVAIPENFRMLNIALVDVGAGTSDISITKDGAIVSYGMIPIAGDSLTEAIARHCLVDFNTAEHIKRQIDAGKDITFTDIMGLPQTITVDALLEILRPAIEGMTKPVAECIKELNGEKAVSAVFVVGGGGKIPGYTNLLAEELDIVKERVALRGKEVMGFVDFPADIEKDSLLVTPVGICLCFYEQNNNFVFVSFNEERVKIYDNGKLLVIDAAMQSDFPHDGLFPKRGAELNYTVDGKSRLKRGALGEAAIITVNGELADIHTPIKANDLVRVLPSTAGENAKLEIRELPEFNQSIVVNINGKNMDLPKFAQVNGQLQSGYYEIQNDDNIEMLNYYTVGQILEFMDVILPEGEKLAVNNAPANKDTKVYENFSVAWGKDVVLTKETEVAEDTVEAVAESMDFSAEAEETADVDETMESGENIASENMSTSDDAQSASGAKTETTDVPPAAKKVIQNIQVVVNGIPKTLSGKTSYVYVDVFEYIDFDLTKPKGSGIVTNLNGSPAEYLKEIKSGDVIDIYWRD